ncbi:N-methyl-L-tryptophan oxidase [Aureimonas sp. AU4]|uniref:N-methyl-L-tryptophan oxidase n=1 Tax=Aureimonas sp. AU4 TaxID=1638163 RepID=UPI000780A660|nr:N-methyl-L-tryptophan oxidase [Aureimonas sp. AU4]
MASRADVLVVGLGAMGSAVLDQLAARGARAVGFDRHTPPHAEGSSHGETRITRRAVAEGDAYVPLVTRSHQIWREIERETGAELFTACGTLVMGPEATGGEGKSDFVHRTLRVAERAGISHEALAGDEIAARFPFMDDTHGTIGCFEPGGGYVRPERCIAEQLARARRNGALVEANTDVLGLEDDGSGVVLRTARGDWRAPVAVVAAGAWTASLLGAPFDRLLSVRRQVLHWFPLAAEAPISSRDPVYIRMLGDREGDHFYGFPPLPGERRVKVATEQTERDTDPGAGWKRVDPAESDEMYARHLTGRLRGVRPGADDALACLYTVTPDGGFIVDRHPSMSRVTVVSACSGHGFKHSAGLGAALAAGLAGDSDSIADLAPFSLRRFG